jgi:hypothetical protein
MIDPDQQECLLTKQVKFDGEKRSAAERDGSGRSGSQMLSLDVTSVFDSRTARCAQLPNRVPKRIERISRSQRATLAARQDAVPTLSTIHGFTDTPDGQSPYAVW